MNGDQLQYYARQHVFAGFSRIVTNDSEQLHPVWFFPACCTRHHCIDWNYVGTPRSRPNKWWIESNRDVWKEWAFAQDFAGQCYYCERWERIEDGNSNVVVALRKKQQQNSRDGVIVVV